MLFDLILQGVDKLLLRFHSMHSSDQRLCPNKELSTCASRVKSRHVSKDIVSCQRFIVVVNIADREWRAKSLVHALCGVVSAELSCLLEFLLNQILRHPPKLRFELSQVLR